MIDCREASRLTAAQPERRLGKRERLALALHRLLCAPCRMYRRQLETLRRAAARLETASPASTPGLDEDARARIIERLRAGLPDRRE